MPPAPENTSLPTITGTAQQGQTLTEEHGAWTNSPTGYNYQWLRCNASGTGCSSISGATAQTYAPVAADVGHELRVQETASNAGGSSMAPNRQPPPWSCPPVPENTALPTDHRHRPAGPDADRGTRQLGPTHPRATPTSGCAATPQARAAPRSQARRPEAYVPVAADVGHTLRVKETASNAGGSSGPAESVLTAVVNAPPQAEDGYTALQSNVQAGDPPARPTPVVISIRSVTVNRHGVASIPLSCPVSATGGCRGKITITIHIVEPRAERARAARCARGCRPLGTASYEARAGQKVRVRVHIASFGRRLLTQRKSVRVTLTATSVSGGQTATVTQPIALKS